MTITADAISGHTFTGVVTSVSKAGTTAGGTTTYPVTIRIDDTGDLLPGMNATAEITGRPAPRTRFPFPMPLWCGAILCW